MVASGVPIRNGMKVIMFYWPKQFHVFSAFYKTDLKKFEISFIGNFYYI
jgi:hypothetical protein